MDHNRQTPTASTFLRPSWTNDLVHRALVQWRHDLPIGADSLGDLKSERARSHKAVDKALSNRRGKCPYGPLPG